MITLKIEFSEDEYLRIVQAAAEHDMTVEEAIYEAAMFATDELYLAFAN